MIINRQRNFGFVHIPKCAGSTIRHQLRPFDDADGRFYRSIEHPVLGRINGNHIPLAVLAEHFPEDFAALTTVQAYAITRDPVARFRSSLAQWLRDDGREPAETEPAAILSAAEAVVGYLESDPAIIDARHILFARQVDFTDLDGRRIVSGLYPLDRLGDFFDVLAKRHDLRLNRESVWNPTVTYKVPKAAAKGLKSAKDLARALLPTGAYAALRDLGVRLFTIRGAPGLDQALERSSRIGDFIAAYYHDDFRLHQAALAALPPPAGNSGRIVNGE